MRILRLAKVSVVVHIRDHNEVTVVVPLDIGPDQALSMARLVLTPEEHDALQEAFHEPSESLPRTAPEACGPLADPCGPPGSPPPPACL